MKENTKYSKPEVATLGTTDDLILGDKIGPAESGFDALLPMDAD
jgi:hypothetical protein